MTTEGMASGDRSGPARKRSPLFTVFFVVVIVLIVVGGLLLFQRRVQYQALANETEAASIPTVAVIHPSVEAGDENLVLPGTLQAYVESPIYARTNGYLRKWYHDIGSRVNKGELLADIDTPEVDQQLGQARADLNTSKANAQLSDITATRFTELLKTDGVSKQEVDNAMGDQAAKRAIVQSSEANLRRLEELESFKHIYAPFGGVLTQRSIDIGTLINAGNGGTSQQLFYLAQTDPIRVYVNVPEPYAPSIHAGIGAYLELTQFPGEKFRGKVVRTSNAIDLSTRTLLTEVDVPNPSGQLLPGGYAQVHLEVTVKGDRLQVPVNSLLFRSEGLRAVVVDSNHKARLQTLTIGRDYGVTLEVLNGLKAGDWIVLNPPDSLNDGQEVHVKEVPSPMAPAAAPAGAPNQTPKAPNAAPMPAGKKP
jgi:RND family efflux transporter MFP subunit